MLLRACISFALAAATLSAFPGASSAADTATGPRSASEAELLWTEGKTAYDAGKWDDAARNLQRLVDRYPAAKGYLEAHLLLGQTLMKLAKPDKAIAPLRYFTQASRSEKDLATARLLLARATMEAGQNHESYLVTLEIEKKHGSSPEIQSEALLIRARALTGLGKDARAAKTLASAKTLLGGLRAEALWLEQTLKLRACARFPSQSPLDEEKVRDQMTRRATCMGEALLAYRAVLKANDPEWARKAFADMTSAFDAFWKSCGNPPSPPEPPVGSKKRRTGVQTLRYREELTAFLLSRCRESLKEQSEQLMAWAPQFTGLGEDFATRLSNYLRQMTR